jgi:hypothetical protein
MKFSIDRFTPEQAVKPYRIERLKRQTEEQNRRPQPLQDDESEPKEQWDP